MADSRSRPPWGSLAIERSPGLIGIHDLSGNILYMNPAAADALGYPVGELVGRNFIELLAPAVQPYFVPALERLRDDGSGEGLAMVITKDGRQRRWWYRHVLLADNGDSPIVLGDSVDITDVHSTDDALQESEQRFRYLAENIHQVFWLRDPHTSQILYLSPAFEQVWGRPRAWMIDQPWLFLDTLHTDDRPMVLENFAKSAGGGSTEMEYRIVRPDGGERWIWSHAFPVRDRQEQVARIVAITEDITERKLAEDALRHARDAAEAATRDKSMLLAQVSHELRTPLNAIFGFTDLLLETALDDEQRSQLEHVAKAARTLNLLANDLLDFSRLGSPNLELRHEPFDVREVLALALEAYATKPKPGVEYHGQVANDVPATLIGDAERLRQVLANLIGNASKFTDRGTVRAWIEVAEADAAGVLLRAHVRDTGRGIAPEDQRRIFEPFSQAHQTTKRDQGGVGLGLAICSQLVALMGGTISLSSAPGQGSTFTFTARLANGNGRSPAARGVAPGW